MKQVSYHTTVLAGITNVWLLRKMALDLELY